MMENIKAKIAELKKLANEISPVQESLSNSSGAELIFLQNFLSGVLLKMKELSSEIDEELAEEGGKSPREKESRVFISPLQKRMYIEEVGIDKEALKLAKKRIEQRKKEESLKSKKGMYEEPGFFVKMAGRYFSKLSLKMVKEGRFKTLNNDLRKANMPFLVPTYLSIAFLAATITFFISILLAILLFSSFGAYALLAPVLLPIATFAAIFFYPVNEASSTKRKLDDELPFAVMHMAAIAGSGVEPSRVFKILAMSKDYPFLRKEMRKLVNQINFYGYDLTAALKNTAKNTPSTRLAEILNGMSTTISGGGNLMSYLDKIAADTLLDYKLRRRKFITISETYADIYTGLLIAAPLMFMLILVLLNVIGGGFGGLSSMMIAVIGIGAIVLVNIGFLIFLEISQPES